MADDSVKAGTTPAAANPAPAGATPAPDATDWAGKYSELESKYNSLKGLEKYKELFPEATPEQVKEGVDWAVNIYKRVAAGELVEKGKLAQAQQALQQTPATSGAPWDQEGWELLPSAQQSRKLAEYMEQRVSALASAKEAQFRQAMEQTGNLTGRSQALLLKAIQAAIKNPNIDVNTVLQKASEAAQMPAEALIDQVISNSLNDPSAQEAKINKLVEERLAAKLQEEENKKLDLISQSSRIPRGLASTAKRTVADENKEIFQKLAKQGIYLQ